MRRLLPILGVIMLLACAAARADEGFLIGPGSIIEVRMVSPGGVNRSDTLRVDRAGIAAHPLLGNVKLGHMTVGQAEAFLEAVLAQQGYADAVVKIGVTVPVPGGRYTIAGAVRRPGTYEVPNEISLANAVQLAGGFLPNARKDKVRVGRKGSTTKNLNYATKSEFRIKAGDEITVFTL